MISRRLLGVRAGANRTPPTVSRARLASATSRAWTGGLTLARYWLEVTNSDSRRPSISAALPDYATNGFFYLLYTRVTDGDEVIARYTRNAINPDLADLASEKVLLRIDDPASNHNGGTLAFGPDGYLYASIGDGGGGGDGWGPCGNGQNRQALLGKMLRIDPNGTTGFFPDCGLDPDSYRIPADNPFADGPGGRCDEIWATRSSYARAAVFG